MKKIIRGIVLGLLAVVVIAASVAAYFLFGQNGPAVDSKLIMTDAKGNSYLAMVDEKSGETLFAVTDADGKIYAAVTDANGNVGNTVGEVGDVVNISDLPTNYNGPSIDISANASDYTGSVESTTAPTESTSQAAATTNSNNSQTKATDNTTTTKKDDDLTAYRIKEYQKLFAGGTWLMEFTSNDEDLGDVPITAAVKNNNVYIATKFQSMDCKILYLNGSGGESGTTYLIIDAFKKYSKMPEDLVGDEMNVDNLMGNFGTEITKEITVSKATVGGKELICESYVADDGSVVKYYFDGDTLVRRDNENTDGTVDSTYISKLTSEVPDSLFEIPSNYGYLNLSFLSGLAS